MTAASDMTFPALGQTMLVEIVDSVCDRPGETAETREARAHDVMRSVLGFTPRDPVEVMLAGMVMMHVELIQDSARDALGDQTDAIKARTKSSIVALDRMLLGFMKELRIAQKRTIAGHNEAETSRAVPVDDAVTPRVEAVKSNAPPAVAGGPEASRPLQRVEASVVPPPVARPEQEWPAPRAHRRTEASVAAMMVVHSPPVTPCGPDNPAWGASALAGLTRLNECLTSLENAPGVAARMAREALLSVGKQAPKHRGAAACFPRFPATGASIGPAAASAV